MKLVVVGGGSSYTPELIDGLLSHTEILDVQEVCLMDVNPTRLDILAGFSKRLLAHHGSSIKISSETNLEKALEGADFVNSLIRVGGMDARIQDERIPLKYNVIGQETTGPGGMMKALRTIPVMLEVAHAMEKVCPNAWLINYTNPSGIIAEALGKHSRARTINLCSGPKMWCEEIVRKMDVDLSHASVDWVGLNHLGFAVRIFVDGQDCTQTAIEAVGDSWNIDKEWLRTMGAIPATYLAYFFHTDRILEDYLKPDHRTRGETVKEIEQNLLDQYSDQTLDHKPELLARRGGGGYSEVAIAAMEAIATNSNERQIIQVLNNGAVDGIPDDASMELACVVNNTGAHPIRFGEIPLAIRGLIQSVKAYESLTVQAAVEESKKLALQALMSHPLVPSWDIANRMFAELVAANKKWIPWAD